MTSPFDTDLLIGDACMPTFTFTVPKRVNPPVTPMVLDLLVVLFFPIFDILERVFHVSKTTSFAVLIFLPKATFT